jgi:hypothetical protein
VTRVRTALRELELREHVRGEIKGFFWMQGEADGATKQMADSYGGNLRRLIASLRSDLGSRNAPFVLGQIGDIRLVHFGFPFSHIVRDAQASVAASYPSTYIVPTDDLDRAADSIHYSSRGIVELGRRFAARLERV